MTSSKISNVAVGFSMNTNTAGNVDTSKKTGKDQPIFASLMSQSGKQNMTAQVSNLAAQSPKQQVTESVKQDKTSTGDTTSIKQVSDKASVVKEKVTDSQDTVTDEIKDVIEKELSVTDEQLEDAMSQLGLTALDLMNPANLAQVTAQLTGSTDTSELLMSNNFLNMMQQIGDIGQKLADSIGISLQDLQTVVEQMDTSQQAQVEISQEMTAGQTNSGNQAEQTDAISDQMISQAADQQSDTSAVVTTSGSQGVVQVQNAEQKNGTDTAQSDTAQTGEADQQVKNQTVDPDTSNESAMGESSEDESQSKLFFQKNSQHSTDVNYAELLTNNMSQNVNTADDIAIQTPNIPAYTTAVNVADVIDQIAEFAKVNVSSEKTSIEMQLNPENLGKVYLQISSTKEGNVTAQLAAQNTAVKEALETQVAELRQTLNQQGIKVDAIEVTVATHEFERNLDQNNFGQQQQNSNGQQQNAGRRSLRADSLDELSGIMTEEEVLAARIMKENGNSMDVIA